MRAISMALAALLSAIIVGCRPAVPPAASTAPVSGNSFVVRDVRVFDGERVIERANVVVRDGRIASVGRAAPSGLPAVEGRGRTLIPGLIDAHAHVPNETALRNALRFGVTTALDMMTRPEFARSQKARRDSIVRTDLAASTTDGSVTSVLQAASVSAVTAANPTTAARRIEPSRRSVRMSEILRTER